MSREHAIAALRRYLLGRGLPRFQMTVIVSTTALAGFAASAALLAAGVSSMPTRYLLAVLLAYAVFLLMVRAWAEYERRRLRAEVDVLDVASALDAPVGGGGDSAPTPGGGGTFGGGGAGRRWQGVAQGEAPADSELAAPASSQTGGAGSWLDLDLDDGALLLVPVALLLGGLLAAAYVIYSAPVLLAEVLLDVALVSGLYRALRRVEPQWWVRAVVRRTWIPVVAVAIFLATGGFVIQKSLPQADSIGDVFERR